jgi:hypothetical protein
MPGQFAVGKETELEREWSMMKRRGMLVVVFLLLGWAALVSIAQERHRLYTETDSSSPAGLKGRIIKPAGPILQILAMPPDEPQLVYQGKITGADRQGFLFEGLPMAKYNLFVIYDDSFYEGCELCSTTNTLTKEDIRKIEYILTESDPYFTKKYFHRTEGVTGRGHFARTIVTMIRKEASSGTGKAPDASKPVRMTFKLVWLKDVGPGWQVVQKRDLYPQWISMNHAIPTPHYSDVLSKIRVAGSIKDMGDLDLTK